MIAVEIRSNLSRMEKALAVLAHEQVPFAAARSLNDVARAARDQVTADLGHIFRDPTEFTRRAVVAPRELSAQKDRLAAVVTLRPIQAKYLLREETGGARSPADNTRRPAQAIVLPGRALPLDAHHNIPAGMLRRLRQKAARHGRGRGGKRGGVVFLPAGAPGNKADIGGYFERAGAALHRLTAFKAETVYRPIFEYRRRIEAVAVARWASAIRRRLHEAVASAR